MDILEQIVARKKEEVRERKELYPVKLLETSTFFPTRPVSLRQYLLRPDKCGIIAEFKRKSPSKGVINDFVSVEETSIGYMQAGAAALSVLTDGEFFGGDNKDLITARKFNFCPILRKDFIIDEYQIIEAKSIGADAILLIAAVLTPAQLKQMAEFAGTLGLEVLMEVHDEKELKTHLNDSVDLVGVNNRNLKTFAVDINTSRSLAGEIPERFVKVSESGISEPATVVALKKAGYQGFLIGGYFMSHSRPWDACAEFIQKIRLMGREEEPDK